MLISTFWDQVLRISGQLKEKRTRKELVIGYLGDNPHIHTHIGSYSLTCTHTLKHTDSFTHSHTYHTHTHISQSHIHTLNTYIHTHTHRNNPPTHTHTYTQKYPVTQDYISMNNLLTDQGQLHLTLLFVWRILQRQDRVPLCSASSLWHMVSSQ